MFCASGIDWGDTGSMLSGIGTILTGIASLVALLVAYPDWKSREVYKARATDARAILAAFYEGRQILESIRSPLSMAAEIDEAEKVLVENGDAIAVDAMQKRRLVQRIVTILRIQRHSEFWEKVFQLLPVAKAVFGTEVESALMSIIRVRQEVYAAADIYPDAEQDRMNFEKKIWRGFGRPDVLEEQLDAAESTLDRCLEPFLKRKSPFN